MSTDEINVVRSLLEDYIKNTKRTHHIKLPLPLVHKSYLPDILESFGALNKLNRFDWEDLSNNLSSNQLNEYLDRPKLAKYLGEDVIQTHLKDYQFVKRNLGFVNRMMEIPSSWTIPQIKEFSCLAPERIKIESIRHLVTESPHDFFFILGNILKSAKHSVVLYNSKRKLIYLLTYIKDLWQNKLISERKMMEYTNDYYIVLCDKRFLNNVFIGNPFILFILQNWKFLVWVVSKIENDPNISLEQFHLNVRTVLAKHLNKGVLENIIRLYDEVVQDQIQKTRVAILIITTQLNQKFSWKLDTIKTLMGMFLPNCQSSTNSKEFLQMMSNLQPHLTLSFGFRFYEKYPQFLTKNLITKFLLESNLECLRDLLFRLKGVLPKNLWDGCVCDESISEEGILVMKYYISNSDWTHIFDSHSFSQDFLLNLIPWYVAHKGNIDIIAKTQSLGSELTSKYYNLINWEIAITNPKIIDGNNWQYLPSHLQKSWVYEEGDSKIYQLKKFVKEKSNWMIEGDDLSTQILLKGNLQSSITFVQNSHPGILYPSGVQHGKKYGNSIMTYYLKPNSQDQSQITVIFNIEDFELKNNLIELKKFRTQ